MIELIEHMPEVYSQSKQTPVAGAAGHSAPKRANGELPSIEQDAASTNPLGAFLIRPNGATLSVLEKDEKIVLLLRQHPITLLPRVLVVIGIIIMGFVFGAMLDLSFLPWTYRFGFQLLWGLFVFGILFEKLVSWYFNAIVITDERVIDVDFLHLIYKNVTVAKIDNIQDITYSVTGVFQALLNYGNVLIQTAGAVIGMAPQQTMASIEIYGTPNPAKVVSVLNDLMLQEEQEKLDGRAK